MDDDYESQAAGDGDTVKLSADVQPWEAALDRAAAKVGEWATSVEGKFKGAGDKITAFTAAGGKKLEELTAKGGGDIGAGFAASVGEFAGSKLGAVLGSALGPVGTVIGNQLGSAIGSNLGAWISENVNAEAIGGMIGDVFKKTDEQVKAVGESWGSVKLDAQDAFDGIKEILRAVSLKDLFADGLAGIPGKLTEIGTQVFDKLNSLGMQATARFADLINGAFERFKEPMGQLADGIQFLLEKLGLIGDSTERWSESLDKVKDAGKAVVGALAYAFGTVKDVIDLTANSVRVGLFTALKFAGEQLQVFLKATLDLADKLGISVMLGIDTAGIKGAIDDLSGAFGSGMDEAIKEAQKNIEKAKRFETGAAWRAGAEPGVDVGRDLNKRVDMMRTAVDYGLAGALAGLEAAEASIKEQATTGGGGTFKNVSATIEGTREAARLAAVDANRGMGGDVQQKLADQQREALAVQKAQLEEAKRLNKNFEKAPPLKSVP